MHEDPILNELRQIRRDIEAECQSDPQKFYEHILKIQEKYLDRVVNLGRAKESESVAIRS